MKRTATLVAAVIVAALAAYANVFDNPFHFDDAHSIVDNTWIRSLRWVPRYFTDVSTFSPLAENRSYRPFLLIGYAVSHAMGGGAPWAYHLITLLLHVAAALCVGGILQLILRKDGFSDDASWIAGGAAALLFAVHPLMSEPVNYISARSSLQAAAGTFGAVWAYIRSREGGGARWLVASAAVLLFAMGTKIIAMTAPALMLAWEILYGTAPWRARLRALVLPAVVALGATLLHEAMLDASIRGARSQIHWWSYFLTQTQVWLRYVGLYVWPQDLCADLTMPWSTSPLEGVTARAILANLLIVVLAARQWRRRPWVTFSVVWFYVTLSPTNSIVPLSEPATEHRVYIAAPGLVWLTVAAFTTWARPRIWTTRARAFAATSAFLTLVALGATTFDRNRVWRSDRALWKSVVDASPTNGRGHLNYGLALMAAGELSAAGAEFDACVQHWPGYVFCYINRAVLALHEGRQADAERQIARAEAIRPNNVYVLQWRGAVEANASRWPSAATAYRRALNVAPGYVPARRGLARAEFESAAFDRAAPILDALRAAGALDADGWFAVGFIAQRKGADAEAAISYERALQLDASHRRARYNLAVALHRTGRVEDAIEHYERLARASDVAPEVLDNLARARAARGELEAARAVRARLRQLAPNYPGLATSPF